MILGIGIDMIEVKRIADAIKNIRFLNKVYTADERALLESRKGNPLFAAGSFAAKEALVKALGTGVGFVKWTEVEVLRNSKGAPYVTLYGGALKVFEEMGGRKIWVSISHSKEHAVAQVIVEGRRQRVCM